MNVTAKDFIVLSDKYRELCNETTEILYRFENDCIISGGVQSCAHLVADCSNIKHHSQKYEV